MHRADRRGVCRKSFSRGLYILQYTTRHDQNLLYHTILSLFPAKQAAQLQNKKVQPSLFVLTQPSSMMSQEFLLLLCLALHLYDGMFCDVIEFARGIILLHTYDIIQEPNSHDNITRSVSLDTDRFVLSWCIWLLYDVINWHQNDVINLNMPLA